MTFNLRKTIPQLQRHGQQPYYSCDNTTDKYRVRNNISNVRGAGAVIAITLINIHPISK